MACVLADTSGCSPAPPSDAGPQPPVPSAAYAEDVRVVSCTADMPVDWQRTIDGAEVDRDGGHTLTVVAGSADGTEVFEEVLRDGAYHLVMVDRGREREVVRLDEGQEPFGFAFDGRWLSFGIGYDKRRQNVWTAHAWDSESDAGPVMIGDNRDAKPGPWFFSHVHDGRVAWVQGVDAQDSRRAVHLYDLAAKTDRVVVEGRVEDATFHGDVLMWREQDETSKQTTLKAYSPEEGGPAEVPQALREATGQFYLSTDERTVAWVGNDRKSLHAWRADWPEPRVVARVDMAAGMAGIQWPRISGDLITWSTGLSNVTDLRTGTTYSSPPNGYWFEALSGGALTVRRNSGRGPDGGSSVVAASALSTLPPC